MRLRQVEAEQERGTSETRRRGIETEFEPKAVTESRQTATRKAVVANAVGKRAKVTAPIAGLTVSLLVFYTASGLARNAMTRLLLTDHGSLNISLEEASARVNVCLLSLWIAQMILSTVAASYVTPRTARWGIALANLLYLLAVTTEYSLAASPIWVLSRSQLTGWGCAILGAVTISVAQIMVAEQLARWRGLRKAEKVPTHISSSLTTQQHSQ